MPSSIRLKRTDSENELDIVQSKIIDSNFNYGSINRTSSAGKINKESKESRKIMISKDPEEDQEFLMTVLEVVNAFEMGIKPELNAFGRKGTYLLKDSSGIVMGIFKPRDEESANDWLQLLSSICCCCTQNKKSQDESIFLPNHGYLSEVGASVVDECLNLKIVPKTRIVRLASDAFNYTSATRTKVSLKRGLSRSHSSYSQSSNNHDFPPKVGSFQLFDYVDSEVASKWLNDIEKEPLPPDLAEIFQLEFEKLVVLDFIIRNTGRNDDNWYIMKCKETPVSEAERDTMEEEPFQPLRVVATDNCSAFPCRMPNESGAYPYSWENHKLAQRPFSQKIKDLVLPFLARKSNYEKMNQDILKMFKYDKKFDEKIFHLQMGILAGQITNLLTAMQNGLSPSELAKMDEQILKAPKISHQQFLSVVDDELLTPSISEGAEDINEDKILLP